MYSSVFFLIWTCEKILELMTVKKSKKPTKKRRFLFFCSLLVVDFYLSRNNTLEIYAFIPTQVESVNCQKKRFY